MIRHIITSILFLIALGGSAQANILDIQEVKSPQGITAWLAEDHTVPVISLRFAFKGSGTAHDPVDKQGLARMLSNTMDEGAGELDSRAFQEKLTDLSISLSFSASRDQFGGEVKTLTTNKDEAFRLLAIALSQPRFDADAVERMRQANLARIRGDMTDPSWMAARLLNDAMFSGHPYSLNSGGTLTTLNKITPDDLRKKVKDDLTRDRLYISVAGDISAQDLSPLLDRIFANLPEKSETSALPMASMPSQGEVILYQKDIPQSVMAMAMPGIDIQDPDYFAAEIFNFIFGGAGFGSRLMDVVREQRGLTYGIYSGLADMDLADMVTVNTSTKNATAAEVLSLTQDVMKGLVSKPVTGQELRDAKTFLTGSVPLDLTSTDAISGYMLAFQIKGLPKNYLDRREKGLKAVSADDVMRVAKRLLDPAILTVILVGKPENLTVTKTVTSLPNVN